MVGGWSCRRGEGLDGADLGLVPLKEGPSSPCPIILGNDSFLEAIFARRQCRVTSQPRLSGFLCRPTLVPTPLPALCQGYFYVILVCLKHTAACQMRLSRVRRDTRWPVFPKISYLLGGDRPLPNFFSMGYFLPLFAQEISLGICTIRLSPACRVRAHTTYK